MDNREHEQQRSRGRIAVDATGGDHGPAVVIPGAIAGARAAGIDLILVGPAAVIEAALAGADRQGVSVTVRDAPDEITMDDHPAQAVRRKPQSGIVVGTQLVRDGEAAGFVSAGNSGAVMAAALMVLGRIPGVERPALAGFIPTLTGRCLLLDLGAVADPKPEQLVQFAQMGSLYAAAALNTPRPRVGLLSNGEEPSKGNQLAQATHPLLLAAPGITFVGNVEGRDITQGTVDVVVTDGFTGNVALKVAEGVASFMGEIIRQEVTASLPRKLAAAVLRPAFRDVRRRLDYAETGGVPLLGVNGVVIIAHGSSNETAIANAVKGAKASVDQDLAPAIARAVAADN